MVKLTPLIRTLLIGLAAAISVVTATQDSLPIWVQAIIVGASTILAGLGIVPPHIPTATVVQGPTSPGTPATPVATQPTNPPQAGNL